MAARRVVGSLDRRQLALAAYLLAAFLLVIAFVIGNGSFISTRRGVTLILACDLVLCGVVLGAPSRARDWRLALPVYLMRVLSETVFGAAFVAATVILLFGHTKPVERFGFFTVALVVLPASVVIAWRSDDSDSQRAWWGASSALLATIIAICAARLSTDVDISARLLVLLLIGRVIAVQCMRLGYRLSARLHERDAGGAYAVVVALLLAAVTFAFVPSSTVTASHFVLALVVAIAIALICTRAWSIDRRVRIAIDLVTAVVIVLGIFEFPPVYSLRALNTAYFVGPVNDVLHGHAMLVDTYSQYGVGMFDVLAGLFSIVPLGYGVFTLVLAAATAALYVCIYAVLRLSIRSQLLAMAGLVVAAIINVYGQPTSYLDFPSTGVLRFGPPWIVVLLAVIAARTEREDLARWVMRAVVVVVGYAAVWSGEAGTYCFGTAVAIALVDSATLPLPLKQRAIAAVRRVLSLVAAVVVAVVLFTLITWVASGSEPHWGPYLDYVKQYTTGGLGALDIDNWSPGLGLGVLYASSAAVIVGLLVARPEVVRANLATFRALTGLTALGTLVYTYFLGRAAPTNLVHISPPAAALLFVWGGIAQVTFGGRRIIAATVVASVAFIGSLAVTGEYNAAAPKFVYSPLGALLENPGFMWPKLSGLANNSTVLYPQTTQLVRFIRSLHVGDRQLSVMAFPPVQTEALMRLGRTTAVDTTNPCQEDISSTGSARALSEVKALKSGGVLVTMEAANMAFITDQDYTLTAIQHRFHLHKIVSADGATAFLLGALKSTWKGGGSIPQPVYGVYENGCG